MTEQGQVGGSRVDLDQLDQHARTLDDLSKRIEQANQATLQTMHPEAFGLLGIPLAAICLIAEGIAAETIGSAQHSAADHVDRVHEWRQRREWDEQEFTAIFTSKG